MKENKRALIILQMLVLTAVVIFLLEKKFLVNEVRGQTLTQYENLKEIDKIIFLVDDFEGFPEHAGENGLDSAMMKNGFFAYGSAGVSLDHKQVDKNPLASKTSLKVQWTGSEKFGGWGKGVGANINLDPATDHLNFRIFNPLSNGDDTLRIIMQEDDNDNGKLEEEQDDRWNLKVPVKAKDQWQIVSVPLKDFVDENLTGDHELNISRKGGLHFITFEFTQKEKYTKDHKWYFDFICFTSEKMLDEDLMK
jgi:hypothetical protein